MKGHEHRNQVALSSLFIGAMVVLCGLLGVLQYRWLGEVSAAARDRLRSALQASLERISRDFDSEIASACEALTPDNPPQNEHQLEAEIAARYARWQKSARQSPIFSRIALFSADRPTALRELDTAKGVFETAQWPDEWKPFSGRFALRDSPNAPGRGEPPGPPPEDDGMSIEIPVFAARSREMSEGPMGRPQAGSMILLRLNDAYIRDVAIPELLQRHLGAAALADYQIQVLARGNSQAVVYQSEPMDASRMAGLASASTALLGSPIDRMSRRGGPPGDRDRGRGRGGPGRGPANDFGRWTMSVSYRAGSLETIVAQLRWRNLAVAAGILLLLVLSAAALVRFTRHSQKLAELQMDFVAGVSHELRTPLAVIHSAGYNLSGKLADNPEQVRRYGALIQEESGRLTQLVERVLQFASAEAGSIVRDAGPLSVETVIASALRSGKALVPEFCTVEKKIDADLPAVIGDALSLKQVLENLISNAVKYGTVNGGWIGVYASKAAGAANAVEIRVTDHGPGIPADEQKQIFEPFFRGRRAIQDQIRGAGLGLNLAKKIVEAHGGELTVRSEPGAGAEFTVRIPAAPEGTGA
jgi:signal transduction histidine kinase